MVGLLCRYCSFSTAGAKVFCSGSTAKIHVTHIKSCNTTDTVFKHSDIRNSMQHWLTVLSIYRLGIPSLSAIIVKDKLAPSLLLIFLLLNRGAENLYSFCGHLIVLSLNKSIVHLARVALWIYITCLLSPISCLMLRQRWNSRDNQVDSNSSWGQECCK